MIELKEKNDEYYNDNRRLSQAYNKERALREEQTAKARFGPFWFIYFFLIYYALSEPYVKESSVKEANKAEAQNCILKAKDYIENAQFDLAQKMYKKAAKLDFDINLGLVTLFYG